MKDQSQELPPGLAEVLEARTPALERVLQQEREEHQRAQAEWDKIRPQRSSRVSVHRSRLEQVRRGLDALKAGIDKRNANPYYTDIEVILYGFLDATELSYEKQFRILRYCADAFIPSLNLVVEADGIYWHSLHPDRDTERDASLAEEGLQTLRLTDQQLKAMSFTEFETRLSEFGYAPAT